MVSFADVKAMLDACAPGHRVSLKTHNRQILWNKRTYPTFPKYDEVEIGHVKKMARYLGILECAKRFLKI